MELKKIAGALFLLLFCLFRAPGLFAQKVYTIEYRYAAADIPGDSVHFQLLRPADRSIAMVRLEDKAYPMKEFRFFREGDSAVCICTFSVADTSCAIVLDGFGHESFIIPGDTARISFTGRPRTDGKIMSEKDLMIMWFHNFTYSGKNRYIYALFDSLTYHADDLRFSSVGLQKADLDLNKFFRMVTDVYRERIEYTDRYCTLYGIPSNIRRLAVAEIRSAYVLNLTRPMTNIVASYGLKDYSREYLDSLAVFDHPDNENIAFKTLLYLEAAYSYTTLYKIKLLLGDSSGERSFKDEYTAIDRLTAHRVKMKERLLSSVLLSNLKSGYPSFGTYLSDYRRRFSGTRSYTYIDSLYTVQKSKPRKTFEQALANMVSDTAGLRKTLKNVLGNKPVFVDCWASWCGPCLAQMPYEKGLVKEYGDKIDFVYLSFDKDRNAWLAKNQALGLEGRSFLLDQNFKSDFAYHFDIEGIPRYLIFDKDGKLVTPNAPRPSSAERLRKALDAVAMKNGE